MTIIFSSRPFKTVLTSLFILFFLTITSSCGSDHKSKVKVKNSDKVVIKESFREKVSAQRSDEYLFLDSNCLYCHKINDRVRDKKNALSMKEITDFYRKTFSTKEEFIKAMVSYGINPIKENSLMKEAVNKYGVMPNSGITKEDMEEISAYLYDYKF